MSNSEMKHPSKLSIAVRSLSQTPAKSTLRHSPKSFSMLALDFGLIFILCGLIVGCVTQLDRLGGGSLDLKLSRSVSSPLSSSSSSSSSFTPLPCASSDLHPSDSFGSSSQRKILEAPSDDGTKSDPPATTGPFSPTSTLGPFESDSERDQMFAQWSTEFTDLLTNSPDVPTAVATFLGPSASSVVVKARQLELSYFVLAVVDYHGTAAAGDERLLFLIKHTWHMLNGASDDPQWALVLFHTTDTEKFWLDKLDIRPGGKGENISLARVTSLAPSNSFALPYSGVFIDRLAPAEYVLYLERDSIMLRSDVLPSASATKPNPYFTLEAMMRRWVHVSAPLSWCPSGWQWCSLGGSIGLSLTRRSDFSTLVREIHCDPRRCWSHDNFKDVKYFTNLKREEGTGEILVASAWESKQLTFGCPESGDKIKVLDHSYGRDQGMIDLYSGSMPKGFCHMPTTLPSQCDNKRSCSLTAHFEPDPCPGYEKRAVVSYTCLNPRSKLAKQNQLAHSPSSSQLAKPPEDPQAVWFPQILYQHRKRFPASHFPTSDESAKFAIQSKDVEGVEPYFLHKAWSLPRDRLIQLIAPVKQYYYKSKQ